MILDEKELSERYNITKVLDIDIPKDHRDKYYQKMHVNEGQFFLYESIVNNKLSYPKIGLYIDSYMVDMALEMEWFDVRRSWEYKVQYKYLYENREYSHYVDDKRREMKSLIIWDDEMYIYGVWDKLPDWKELKKFYDKTLWFKKDIDVLRNQKLHNLLR